MVETVNDDATVIQTVPARKADPAGSSNAKEYAQVTRSAHSPQPAAPSAVDISTLLQSENKLVAAATNVLSIIAELKRPQTDLDLNKLRQHLTIEIKSFDVKAKSIGVSETVLVLARYVLCAVSDEFVLDTPWGANSNWSEYSLLSVFHQDSAGGQKFFSILERILQEPAVNIELIELMYICLNLGFVGKYRITERGHDQLAGLKESVYKQIRVQRGERDISLSIGTTAKAKLVNQVQQIPYLKLLAIIAGSLLVIYLALHFVIKHQSNKVAKELRNVVVDNAVLKQVSKRSTE